jgi:hypothetical protein
MCSSWRARSPAIARASSGSKVREDHIGIGLEGIEHAVAMVHIDVDIGDRTHAAGAEHFDEHTDVVEDAEAGGGIARRVMQASDGHEGPIGAAIEQRLGRRQRGGPPLAIPAAAIGRRVAAVEAALAGHGLRAHEFHMPRGVESQQVRIARQAGGAGQAARRQPAGPEFAHEGRVPVGAEGVAVGKAVAAEGLVCNDEHAAVALILRCGPGVQYAFQTITGPGASPIIAAFSAGSRKSSHGQYIYTMNRVSKVVPPKRFILRDIS